MDARPELIGTGDRGGRLKHTRVRAGAEVAMGGGERPTMSRLNQRKQQTTLGEGSGGGEPQVELARFVRLLAQLHGSDPQFFLICGIFICRWCRAAEAYFSLLKTNLGGAFSIHTGQEVGASTS